MTLAPVFSLPVRITPARERVIELVIDPAGLTYAVIGERLALQEPTVRDHVYRTALYLPGRAPARVRVTLWALGAPRALLERLPWPTHHRSTGNPIISVSRH